MQFHEINFCRVMNFTLHTVYNKHDDDKNWRLNERTTSIITSGRIILLTTVMFDRKTQLWFRNNRTTYILNPYLRKWRTKIKKKVLAISHLVRKDRFEIKMFGYNVFKTKKKF